MTRENVKQPSMKKKIYKPTQQYGGVHAVQRLKERKDKFIESGLEIFGTVGYARSTIKGICQHAGLTERYFYESFQSKEELLSAVYQRLISEIEHDAESIIKTQGMSTTQKAYESLKMFYVHFLNDPRKARVQLYEVLGVSPRVDQEYQSAMSKLANWVALLVREIFPDIDPERLQNSVIPTAAAGAIIEVADKWVIDGLKKPVDDIVTELIDVFKAVGFYLEQNKKL